MPWLADLVQSSEGSLDVLPVQCLCEFLLHDAADDSLPIEDDDEAESKEQKAKKRQVCILLHLTEMFPFWHCFWIPSSKTWRLFICLGLKLATFIMLLFLYWLSTNPELLSAFLLETTKAKTATRTAPGSSVGSQGRRADNVWSVGLFSASP